MPVAGITYANCKGPEYIYYTYVCVYILYMFTTLESLGIPYLCMYHRARVRVHIHTHFECLGIPYLCMYHRARVRVHIHTHFECLGTPYLCMYSLHHMHPHALTPPLPSFTATPLLPPGRTVSLDKLKLRPLRQFSLLLVLDRIGPAVLLNLAHLAGYLDAKHSLSTILRHAHSLAKTPPAGIVESLPYQQLCDSLLQLAATKALHLVLLDESMVQLLSYQPPPLEVVIAGEFVDKSELAQNVCHVLQCMAARAVRPSPLKPTLRLGELERVHSVLSFDCLAAVAECEAA